MAGGFGRLGAFGLGAAAMYFLDPERGRRRRALARDQLVHLLNKLGDAAGATSRDVMHRAIGTGATLRSMLIQQPVDDVVLAERVRARLGRVVSHPSAIEVMAREGRVILRGPILARELEPLLDTVRRVRGVREVENQLEPHRTAEDVPSLQGEAPPPAQVPDIFQRSWSPTTRFVAGLTGGLLSMWGLSTGGPAGALAALAGAALVARGATNVELRRLLGLSGRRAIDLHKTINVHAPVEEVFAFFRHIETFPRYMAHVREVHDLGNGRSHWEVAGPAGTTVRWDAEITRLEPNRVLAWKTIGGPLVRHAGIVHFTPGTQRSQATTTIDLHLSYNPPGGALGHMVATLLGAGPKRALDEDLVRFKSLLEDGKASAPGKHVTREELMAVVELPAPAAQAEAAPTEPASAGSDRRRSPRRAA